MLQGIFAAGDEANGLRDLRPRYGFTDEDDRLWPLGWPHLYILTEGDAPARGLTSTDAFFRAFDKLGPEIPAGVAVRLVRAYCRGRDAAAIVAALQRDEPLTDEEAEHAAHIALSSQFARTMIYALEALRTSAWVLDRMLNSLAGVDGAVWKARSSYAIYLPSALSCIAMVMRRSTKGDVERTRAELAALEKQIPYDSNTHEIHRLLRMIRGASDDIHDYYLFMATEAQRERIRARVESWLSSMRPADGWTPDARLCFLASDDLIAAHAKHVGRFNKAGREQLAVQFSRCARPEAVEVMRAVDNAFARRWLKVHGH